MKMRYELAKLVAVALVGAVGFGGGCCNKSVSNITNPPLQSDLVVTQVLCPGTAQKLTSFTVTDTTLNTVNTTEIPSKTYVYLCSDTNNVMATRCSQCTHNVGILSAGQTETKSCTIFVSNSCPASTMWIVVVANKTKALNETTYGNNTNTCGPITITP